MLDGQSGIRKIDDPFIEQFKLPVRIGGHLLEDFDQELTRVELRRMLFLQKISVVLGRRVWANAGSPEVDTNRLMVSIGTGMGSTEEMVFGYDDIRARGLKAVNPVGVLMCMPNSGSAWVGLERGAKAGVITPVSADASGAEAIALAWRNLVLGEADIAICGASRPESRQSPSRRLLRWACCRPTTTTRPARVARSTKTATASCSAKQEQCWSSRRRRTRRPAGPQFSVG
ncbi:3-oxoacyl-[acyl-carrier-protein] synthase 2 [Mycobacterium xenopi 4042]|uniref:3-oxoacyl-[acyl-carrier-protein] synthase 2 n=1 Tax=Mycobacterium xenopi 4042 TaxID=1299334 RepID=X8DJS1_MYCXE|nr:3-oxoacyl-[acyl-carrier-protein] synthase 2 [Mycobacterium xenopi 4042]